MLIIFKTTTTQILIIKHNSDGDPRHVDNDELSEIAGNETETDIETETDDE